MSCIAAQSEAWGPEWNLVRNRRNLDVIAKGNQLGILVAIFGHCHSLPWALRFLPSWPGRKL